MGKAKDRHREFRLSREQVQRLAEAYANTGPDQVDSGYLQMGMLDAVRALFDSPEAGQEAADRVKHLGWSIRSADRRY
jgi:hypothetical protein